jgi:Tfp pilus assembly protein PilN
MAIPVAAAVPVVALGFLFFQASGTVADREAEVDAVRAQIAALPKPKIPIIDDSVAATEAARAVALAGVLGGRVSWDGVLRDVSLVLPGNVSLTRLEAQLPPPAPPGTTPASGAAPAPTVTVGTPVVPTLPTGVQIEGYTTDQQSVARLLARLRTVPSLSNVQLESSTRETVGRKTIVSFVVLADITQLGGVQ